MSRFSAWLNTDRCRDLLRKRGRVREITLEGANLQQADPGPAALERAAVLAAFDRLSVADRQILAMHHLLDQPLEQIAQRLSIPVGTAKSRLHAARQIPGSGFGDSSMTKRSQDSVAIDLAAALRERAADVGGEDDLYQRIMAAAAARPQPQ